MYIPALWNRNDLLRFPFRFLLWKSFSSGCGCGCGSDSGSGSRLILHSFSTTTKTVQNLAFSMLKQHWLPESWPPIFDFFTFVLHFMLDPGPNPVPGSGTRTRMHYGSGKKLRFFRFRFRFHNTGT
jgi:hypothetical protein